MTNLIRDMATITRLRNHTAEVARDVPETGRPLVITQDGKPTLVVMSVEHYDRWQDAAVILKIIALDEADIAAGRLIPQREVFRRLKKIATTSKDT